MYKYMNCNSYYSDTKLIGFKYMYTLYENESMMNLLLFN